jgi:hypothetical protein
MGFEGKVYTGIWAHADTAFLAVKKCVLSQISGAMDGVNFVPRKSGILGAKKRVEQCGGDAVAHAGGGPAPTRVGAQSAAWFSAQKCGGGYRAAWPLPLVLWPEGVF